MLVIIFAVVLIGVIFVVVLICLGVLALLMSSCAVGCVIGLYVLFGSCYGVSRCRCIGYPLFRF